MSGPDGYCMYSPCPFNDQHKQKHLIENADMWNKEIMKKNINVHVNKKN